MVHNELHAIDLGIIAAYLIAMVTIGVVMVKRVQNTDDYYLGGRSFGPLVLMATVCATIIGGSGLMGRAGVAYSSGFKAIMTALPYLLVGIALLFVWFILMNRSGGSPNASMQRCTPRGDGFCASATMNTPSRSLNSSMRSRRLLDTSAVCTPASASAAK